VKIQRRAPVIDETFDAPARPAQNRTSSFLINHLFTKGTDMPRTAIDNLKNT